MNGWVKLHRKLLDHPRFCDPDWVAVWIYILLNAASHPHQTMFDGKVIRLKPGQFVCGRLKMAEKTGVSQSKVWRILETLKNEHQIEQQAGTKSSLFTVVNWESYQITEQQNEQQPSNSRATAEQQLSTTREVQEEREDENGADAPAPKALKFKPPTEVEVKFEAVKVGLPETEAEKFFAYYGSNGWRVGRSPMKSWRHALTNWKLRWEETRGGGRRIESNREELTLKGKRLQADLHYATGEERQEILKKLKQVEGLLEATV